MLKCFCLRLVCTDIMGTAYRRFFPLCSQAKLWELIHALVTSRIDYCNSLLFGVPEKQLYRLWLIQNSAARIVTHSLMSDHITLILFQLHWLPVSNLVHYKVLLLTYKTLHNLAPLYLSDLLQIYIPWCSLRSSLQTFYSILLNTVFLRICVNRDRVLSKVSLCVRFGSVSHSE